MPINERPRTGDIQSVHRALDLLEAVGRSGDLGVTEMAHELGLAVSTVHNILRTLARRNYLISDNGRYRLGPGVTVLTSQWDPIVSLSSLLKPALNQLSQSTGHAATATALVGREARLIGFEAGPSPVTVGSSQWTWKNPLALATGRILVAMTREPEWAEFIAAGQDAEPGWSSAKWHEELTTVCRTGTCTKQARGDHEAVGVAVPVWTRGSSVICSIGCSAPAFLTSDDLVEQMLAALWDMTADISARLGCAEIPVFSDQR